MISYGIVAFGHLLATERQAFLFLLPVTFFSLIQILQLFFRIWHLFLSDYWHFVHFLIIQLRKRNNSVILKKNSYILYSIYGIRLKSIVLFLENLALPENS